MAAANASAAWSGLGTESSESSWLTMYCTCSLSAVPVPTTASLIWRGVNSPTLRFPSAQATSAAPRAWPVANAAVMFCPNHTVSIPTHVGLKRSITAPICSWILRRRKESSTCAGDDTQPYAMHESLAPRCDTIPQPVFARPGSIPSMMRSRIATVLPCIPKRLFGIVSYRFEMRTSFRVFLRKKSKPPA